MRKLRIKKYRLIVVGFERKIRVPTRVILLCDCGNTINRNAQEFFKGNIKSCGCISKEIINKGKEKKREKERIREQRRKLPYKPKCDLIGMIFGKLTVLHLCAVFYVSRKKKKIRQPLWYCQCECGKFVIRYNVSLHKDNPSCGCATIRNHNINYKANRANLAKANIILQEQREELLRKGWLPRIQEDHKNRRNKKTLRNKVLTKFNNSCVRCGKENSKEEPLHIHHYRSHSKHPCLRYLISNNVSLCEECHDSLHKILGFVDPPIKEQYKFIKQTA